MQICKVRSENLRDRCRDFLADDPITNVLVLSDLYFPLSRCSEVSAAIENNHIVGVSSIYHAFSKPSVVLAGVTQQIKLALLLDALGSIQDKFISLCQIDDVGLFEGNREVLRCWREYQMIADNFKPQRDNRTEVQKVRSEQLESLKEFYIEQHAEAWAPIQFEAGPYYCVSQKNKIVSAAGVHCVAPQIVQLGNIFTDQAYRNRGYATACINALASDVAVRNKIISLFVRTENAPALHVYERLGFKKERTMAFLLLDESHDDPEH